MPPHLVLLARLFEKGNVKFNSFIRPKKYPTNAKKRKYATHFWNIHLMQNPPNQRPLTLVCLCSISDLPDLPEMKKCTPLCAKTVALKSLWSEASPRSSCNTPCTTPPRRRSFQLSIIFRIQLKPVILAEGCKHGAKAYAGFLKGLHRFFFASNEWLCYGTFKIPVHTFQYGNNEL